MKLIFAEQAWEDYLYWQQTDKKIVKRINLLIKEISLLLRLKKVGRLSSDKRSLG